MRYELYVNIETDTCLLLDTENKKRSRYAYIKYIESILVQDAMTQYDYPKAFIMENTVPLEFSEMPSLKEIKQKYPEWFI